MTREQLIDYLESVLSPSGRAVTVADFNLIPDILSALRDMPKRREGLYCVDCEKKVCTEKEWGTVMIREVKFAKCPYCKTEHRVFDGNLVEEHSPEYVKRNCANCGKEFWLVAYQIMKFIALKPPRKQKLEEEK